MRPAFYGVNGECLCKEGGFRLKPRLSRLCGGQRSNYLPDGHVKVGLSQVEEGLGVIYSLGWLPVLSARS